MATADKNLDVYNNPDVVEYYAATQELPMAEQYLFGKYIQASSDILDLGVGGGRTTRHLSSKARRYVGVDYSQAMIESCRKKFPQTDLRWGDATDLREFEDASFDVAVFSFNGIDSIRTDEARGRCLSEVRRILRPGGGFIFSSHNARMTNIWPPSSKISPEPRPQSLSRTEKPARRRLAERLKIKAVGRRLACATHAVTSAAFYRGHGYMHDPVYGGLWMHTTTPKHVSQELQSSGLLLLEKIGCFYPDEVPSILTNWYHYVAVRP
jgi:ubiquinone/menaquinone biosynthesis C-methylase UbiE